jgi:hypothetical protein
MLPKERYSDAAAKIAANCSKIAANNPKKQKARQKSGLSA